MLQGFKNRGFDSCEYLHFWLTNSLQSADINSSARHVSLGPVAGTVLITELELSGNTSWKNSEAVLSQTNKKVRVLRRNPDCLLPPLCLSKDINVFHMEYECIVENIECERREEKYRKKPFEDFG